MNLLNETVNVLNKHGKCLSDIVFVYTDEGCFCPSKCGTQFLNVEYDNGYGSNEIRADLKLVGNGFWLERAEYDGSEWWEYKEVPQFTPTCSEISPYAEHANTYSAWF